jgi:hypothetical protein
MFVKCEFEFTFSYLFHVCACKFIYLFKDDVHVDNDWIAVEEENHKNVR